MRDLRGLIFKKVNVKLLTSTSESQGPHQALVQLMFVRFLGWHAGVYCDHYHHSHHLHQDGPDEALNETPTSEKRC